ncbi:MAG: hypothetical protein CML04_00145 [Pseudozobellia sp.]|nr:hypothetical protein [Pseudozobellia sp.]MBG48985.1 hypothetical protein [Pseudozobellia sp.]|tara:strand:- start:12735 stop:13772 length:1038 start_codon:yes stop_codon:yes gene_type:complete
MKKKFLKFGYFAAVGSLLLTACDNDDDGDNMMEEPSDMTSAQLFASNNTDGNVTIYNMSNGEVSTLVTGDMAAEGIYYDDDTDQIIQASRSSNQLDIFSDISILGLSATITASISSSADLQSPRDIAVNDDFVIVSDNADVDGNEATPDGRIFIYTRSNGELTLRNVVTTDFALWGIEMVGDDLYAVVDKTSELAVFTEFTAMNTSDEAITASKRIAIEGIVRTHGIAYDNGTMILTDVGDAASDSDGGFHIITDFTSKFEAVANGGTMAVASNQTRIAGSSTYLGNPVAAEYDAASNTVFIAEAANGGGRVMAFTDADAGGNIAPSVNNNLSKASSLYFYSNMQ